MGLYIKGMEMPLPGTFNIIYIYSDGQVHMPSWGKGMTPTNGVKAIPIPPHGRLIDANEFLKRAIGTKCFRGDFALMLEELVGESTTIIPASEEVET